MTCLWLRDGICRCIEGGARYLNSNDQKECLGEDECEKRWDPVKRSRATIEAEERRMMADDERVQAVFVEYMKRAAEDYAKQKEREQ